jgi:hypothetical protein
MILSQGPYFIEGNCSTALKEAVLKLFEKVPNYRISLKETQKTSRFFIIIKRSSNI